MSKKRINLPYPKTSTSLMLHSEIYKKCWIYCVYHIGRRIGDHIYEA